MSLYLFHAFYKHLFVLLLFSLESLSEAVKILKVEYLAAAINEHKMDQAIIFCRTKLDCDNAEHYLISQGGGKGEEMKHK